MSYITKNVFYARLGEQFYDMLLYLFIDRNNEAPALL